jgi:hypothetical protein
MDGEAVDTHIEKRRLECLLVSFGKIQKPMRKTRHSRGRNAEFYVISTTLVAEQPAEFRNGEELPHNNVKTSGRYSTITSRSYCNK